LIKITYDAQPGSILDTFPNGDFTVMTGDFPVYVRDYVCEDKFQIKAGKAFRVHSGEQLPTPEI